MSLKSLLARLRAYIDHPDPLVATTNLVCLIVASNVPFNPIYYFSLIGWNGWPSLLQLPVAPVFFAIPWVARRHSLLGRALLPLIGTLNCLYAMRVLGQGSGNALYLVPCIVVAALSFRANERWVMLPLVWFPVAVFLLSLDYLGAPLVPYTEAEFATMLRLNVISVGIFVGFIGMLYGRSGIESARASR